MPENLEKKEVIRLLNSRRVNRECKLFGCTVAEFERHIDVIRELDNIKKEIEGLCSE